MMQNYVDLLQHIVKQYTKDELVQICKILNKTYNIYDSEDIRWNKLEYTLSNTPPEDLTALREVQLSNRVVNDLIFKYYHCERVVKYYLIKKLIHRQNHIVAFEMAIGSSRIDICRINGSSYAYEIKTAYDTYDRLSSQLEDYCKAFEHVYLVVPLEAKKEAYNHIPNNCGLITYHIINDIAKFSYARKALPNEYDLMSCICSLSSSDLSSLLKILKCKDIPVLKQEKINMVLAYAATHNIWPAYKVMLKDKYSKRWNFIVQHFDEIIPIDIQNFFSSAMSPSLAYLKKSV